MSKNGDLTNVQSIQQRPMEINPCWWNCLKMEQIPMPIKCIWTDQNSFLFIQQCKAMKSHQLNCLSNLELITIWRDIWKESRHWLSIGSQYDLKLVHFVILWNVERNVMGIVLRNISKLKIFYYVNMLTLNYSFWWLLFWLSTRLGKKERQSWRSWRCHWQSKTR